jgi:murein DD-endopeptidase MepM/ murein hydrolase activator NlpD
MKKLTCHHKRLKFTYIKVHLLVLFCSIFFAKGLSAVQKTGDNYFHLKLNGVEVGIVEDLSAAEELVLAARKNIASQSSQLVFLDADLTYEGEEVLWGYVDAKQAILANMEEVLRASVKETMHRSYTVKVNEYMVNLASAEEVTAFLQAAIRKYDTEGKFSVELVQDSSREVNVLTAAVVSTEEKEKEEEKPGAFLEAGIQARFTEMILSAEPNIEKGFDDYERGLLGVGFTEKVEIVEAYLPRQQLRPLEQAIEEVTKEQEKNTVYEVQPGDTLSEISIRVNIPMDKIIEMNESLEDENTIIREGQELIITVPEPELSVERLEQNYYEEIYDADVVYVDNDGWYTTQTKILQEASAGFRKVIARTAYLNDQVVSREIEKEEIVMEAVAKVVERGTKIPPTYIKPVSGGRFTSGFGRRKAPVRGASTYHKGVDWSVPVGTTVVASSGGTVVKAGWGSGYGYVVYLSHADGRQTRYGHLSKVLVKTGQTVKQGEKIALSGNTGISTGPHVHFEILINGSQVNPLKYLN